MYKHQKTEQRGGEMGFGDWPGSQATFPHCIPTRKKSYDQGQIQTFQGVAGGSKNREHIFTIEIKVKFKRENLNQIVWIHYLTHMLQITTKQALIDIWKCNDMIIKSVLKIAAWWFVLYRKVN